MRIRTFKNITNSNVFKLLPNTIYIYRFDLILLTVNIIKSNSIMKSALARPECPRCH